MQLNHSRSLTLQLREGYSLFVLALFRQNKTSVTGDDKQSRAGLVAFAIVLDDVTSVLNSENTKHITNINTNGNKRT